MPDRSRTSPSDRVAVSRYAAAAKLSENAAKGNWFSYTAWYPIVYFAGGGDGDLAAMRVASVVLLSLALVARLLLTYAAVWRWTRRGPGRSSSPWRSRWRWP